MLSGRKVGGSIVGGLVVGGFNKTHKIQHNILDISEAFTTYSMHASGVMFENICY